MATPNWVTQTLQRHGVPYRECHHGEAYTAQQVAQQEHVSGHRVAKVVVVMADDRPVELVLPASRRVLLDRLRNILGAQQVRLATEPEIQQAFPDCEVGAIPPLDHWPGVEIVMDSDMKVDGEILFQAGTHEDAIRVPFRDWYEAMHPRVATFAAPEGQPGDHFEDRQA
jgi:Ala-tRNA(Pro) deacylase